MPPRPEGRRDDRRDDREPREFREVREGRQSREYREAPSGRDAAAPAAIEPAPVAAPAPRPIAGPPEGVDEAGKTFNQKAYDEIFDRSTRFSDLGLSEPVLRAITDLGYEHPTAIQAKIIPIILTGKDVLGQAKTGTGKTASFGLPVLERTVAGTPFQTLILVPTRELAIQVAQDLTEMGKYTGLTALPVYGGQNIATQAQRLQRGPEIIVATPGRFMDMIERRYVHYSNFRMVVLDEVDRMLDIGFRDDIKKILGSCPKDRQTVFVSATMNSDIEALARSYAKDCEKIIATSGSLTVSMVKQFYLPVAPWDKKQLLLHLLTHESPALTVVFCRTKKTVDNLTEYLNRKGIDAHAIHGDMYQGKRNKVIEQLRGGKLAVLVASDLASRGLDVEGITHVVNYDLPEDPDLYVHRIGRTARAGRDGVAWALVTPEQGPLLTEIELLINAEIPKLDYPDFVPGPVPADVLAAKEHGQRRQEVAKTFNRFAGKTLPAVATTTAAPVDASKFPGGVVPTKLPPRMMGGRVKTRGAVRAQIAQTMQPGATAPAPGAPATPGGEAPADAGQ